MKESGKVTRVKTKVDATKLFNEIMERAPWLAYKDVSEFVDHAIRKHAVEVLSIVNMER